MSDRRRRRVAITRPSTDVPGLADVLGGGRPERGFTPATVVRFRIGATRRARTWLGGSPRVRVVALVMMPGYEASR
jgi:hypothetical protein